MVHFIEGLVVGFQFGIPAAVVCYAIWSFVK